VLAVFGLPHLESLSVYVSAPLVCGQAAHSVNLGHRFHCQYTPIVSISTKVLSRLINPTMSIPLYDIVFYGMDVDDF